MTVIGTNISALRASNASSQASSMLATSMERLSTGKRINSAKDDAAGLAIASRMTSAVKSMAVAVRNANDGISLAQTAEGALGEVTNMLQRMKELATQSSSGTLKDSDRTTMQAELSQLTSEIANVSKTTNFNGVNLLDGSAGSIKLQTGINQDETISMSMVNTSTAELGITAKVTGTALVGTATALAANDLTINGQAIGAAGGASAKDLALAINAQSTNSGVKAVASNSVTANMGTMTVGSALVINGTTVTLTAAEKDSNSLATKINTALGSTNSVKASVDSQGGLVLSAKDGSNISLTDASGVLSGVKDAGGTGQTLSATATVLGGKISLEANPGVGLKVTLAGGAATATGIPASRDISVVSIATQTGASSAMAVIDAALDKISAGRGDLGAVQNRLQSTVNNLTTTSTNLADAKGRIEDTDFSAETTALAKAQILSQASTAMLSQANQSQQSVLKLLQ